MRAPGPTPLEVDVRALLGLAIPSAVFVILTNGYRSVDQYFAQHLSVAAQAAIGASIFVLIFALGFFEVVAAGAAPLVARSTGAGDDEARRRSLGAGLFGGLVVAALTALSGLMAEEVAAAIGLGGDTATEAARYLEMLAFTALPLVLTPLLDLSFTAIGNARAPLVLHALSLSLNLVLTPLLIEALGIAGAALASNLARGVATGIGLVLLSREVGLRWRDVRPGPELLRILRIGAPVGASTILYALVYWAMLRTSISPLGPAVNAALGIGFSALEGFTWPAFHGVSLAVASFVGRALGAGRPEVARRAVKLGIPIIAALGTLASLAFWLGGAPLTAIFASDAEVHRAATEYAVILAASQLFVAFEALYEGVLLGAGDTRRVLYWNALNLLRVPLAWWFAIELGYGAPGVWWVINLTTIAKAVGKGWVTHRGRWTEIAL